MSLGGCVRVWIAIWALEVLLTIAFVPAARLAEVAEAEYHRWQALAGAMGAEVAAERTGRWLLRVFPVAGTDRDGEPAMRASRRGADVVGERVRALLVLIAFRLSAWHGMAIAGTLCLIAAAVDGLMVRRRRAFTFASTKTALYNAAGYLLICAFMSLMLCIAAPAAVPLMVPLTAALIAGLATWLLCAHLPGPSTIIGARE